MDPLQNAMKEVQDTRDSVMKNIERRHEMLHEAMKAIKTNDDKIEHSEKLKKINDALDDLML